MCALLFVWHVCWRMRRLVPALFVCLWLLLPRQKCQRQKCQKCQLGRKSVCSLRSPLSLSASRSRASLLVVHVCSVRDGLFQKVRHEIKQLTNFLLPNFCAALDLEAPDDELVDILEQATCTHPAQRKEERIDEPTSNAGSTNSLHIVNSST